jgi:AraC family transcriptional regulator
MRPRRTGALESLASQTLPRHALAEKSAKSADAMSPCQCEMHLTARRVHTHAPAGSRFHSGDYGDDSDSGGPAGNDYGSTLSPGCGRYRIESVQSWGSISADIVSRTVGEVVWRSDRHRTIFALTDIVGTNRSDNGAVQTLWLPRGTFAFRPSRMVLRSILPAPARFIRILQSPETYDSIISDMVRGGAVDLQPQTAFYDPLVSQIVLTIANEIDRGFFDQILADALSTALAVRILRRCLDASAIMLAPLNGLSRERLRRVRDYIETHLDDPLTLADLAAVACLSPYHFSRSFKQSVGVGPQRYVMRRRIERAKTLMRRTNRPIVWIAQEAGFADQSHLTSVFRREIGMTPGRFRAALA